MCGIITVFGSDMSQRTGQIAHDLLLMDQLRGKHSTGVMKVDGQGGVQIRKEAVDATTFLADSANATFVKGAAAARAVIGHNRYATMGAHTDENAHPFQHNHITMVHNGSLQSQATLATDEDHRNFAVDSDQVAFTLSQWSVARTVRNIDGAFTLVWHDKDDNSINLVRNDERPFFLAKCKDKDVYIGASEKFMLLAACVGRGSHADVELEWLEELPVGEHWKFALGTGSFANKTSKPVRTAVDLMPESEKSFGKWGNYSGYYGNYSGYSTKKSSTAHVSRSESPAKLDDKRTNKIRDELAALGFEKGQEVPVYLSSFQEYTGGGTGKGALHGCTVHAPWCDVVIHGVDKDGAEIGEYKGRISSITQHGKNASGEAVKDQLILLSAELTESWEGVADGKPVDDPYEDDLPWEPADEDVPAALVEGPGNKMVTEDEFDTLTKHGCSNCQCNLDYTDAILWLPNHEPICESCAPQFLDEGGSLTDEADATNQKILGDAEIYSETESKADTEELDSLPRANSHPEKETLSLKRTVH